VIDHDNLEEFNDPGDYDIQYGGYEPEGPFYSSLAHETGGPVLELACGTGRVAIPLAERGFDVTGVDLSEPMLRYARRKSAHLPIRWILADCRAFALKQQFGLIFLTGNAFQMFLTRADQESLLARVREHLSANGFFAFETRNLILEELMRDQSVPVLTETYTDVRVRTVRTFESSIYDPATQIEHYTMTRRWEESGREHESVNRIAIRYPTADELDTLLRDNGFVVLRRYGDWDLNPVSPTSRSLIYVCKLKPE
jgi:SAM-dependent methyltransferase